MVQAVGSKCCNPAGFGLAGRRRHQSSESLLPPAPESSSPVQPELAQEAGAGDALGCWTHQGGAEAFGCEPGPAVPVCQPLVPGALPGYGHQPVSGGVCGMHQARTGKHWEVVVSKGRAVAGSPRLLLALEVCEGQSRGWVSSCCTAQGLCFARAWRRRRSDPSGIGLTGAFEVGRVAWGNRGSGGGCRLQCGRSRAVGSERSLSQLGSGRSSWLKVVAASASPRGSAGL